MLVILCSAAFAAGHYLLTAACAFCAEVRRAAQALAQALARVVLDCGDDERSAVEDAVDEWPDGVPLSKVDMAPLDDTPYFQGARHRRWPVR